MSIGGVHAEYGWSEFSLDDAAVKQAGLGQAARTVAVADATKLGVRAFSQVGPLGAAGTFVTDAAAADAGTHPNGPQTLDALRDAGVGRSSPDPSGPKGALARDQPATSPDDPDRRPVPRRRHHRRRVTAGTNTPTAAGAPAWTSTAAA